MNPFSHGSGGCVNGSRKVRSRSGPNVRSGGARHEPWPPACRGMSMPDHNLTVDTGSASTVRFLKGYPMLPPGHRINTTYEVVKLAGQGGMAIVYQVRHLGDGTLYALKVFVHPSTKLASYFEDEARLLRELGHPHIPSVVEIGKILLENQVSHIHAAVDRIFRIHPLFPFTRVVKLSGTLHQLRIRARCASPGMT